MNTSIIVFICIFIICVWFTAADGKSTVNATISNSSVNYFITQANNTFNNGEINCDQIVNFVLQYKLYRFWMLLKIRCVCVLIRTGTNICIQKGHQSTMFRLLTAIS